MDRSDVRTIPLYIIKNFNFIFWSFFFNDVHPGALQPWVSSRRRISQRAICSTVVVRDCSRKGEVAPAGFYCYLEEGVPGKAAPAVFRVPQRGEFPREQMAWFCSGNIWNKQSTLGNQFFCSGGILFMQSTTWVFCSVGNPPTRGNIWLKCTWIDKILKKF
jgi:hypothetical protein